MESIEYYEKIISILESIVTILGIFGGAIISYFLFWKNREIKPKADIENKLEIIKLDKNDFSLITLHVTVKNYGKVLLKIKYYEINIQSLIPSNRVDELTGSKKNQSNKILEIGSLENLHTIKDDECTDVLEPNEKHVYTHTFMVSNKIEIIKIKSFFTNSNKSNLGWEAISTFKI